MAASDVALSDLAIDITEPGYGIGFVRDLPISDCDWSIMVSREGRTWKVWTDDHGSAEGSTLAVAVKRWAVQYGIQHGTAAGEYEYNGKPLAIEW